MTTQVAERERGPGAISWLVGCVLVGWVVVYNIMRFSGSTPSAAGWVSLAIGGVAGAAAFGAGVFAVRRLAASGRVVRHGSTDIPSPAEMSEAQRTLVQRTWPCLAALALVALAMGVALGADWLRTDSADRATTLIVLAAWNILAALWIGDESLRLQRLEADGLESVALAAVLTAVLAGVGVSRGFMEPGQMVLIVVAGIAGVAATLLIWRLRGARHVPAGAVVVAIVAALALILPLAT